MAGIAEKAHFLVSILVFYWCNFKNEKETKNNNKLIRFVLAEQNNEIKWIRSEGLRLNLAACFVMKLSSSFAIS